MLDNKKGEKVLRYNNDDAIEKQGKRRERKYNGGVQASMLIMLFSFFALELSYW